MRLLADNGSESIEDGIFVSVEAGGDARVYANRGPAVDLGPDRGIYDTEAVLQPVISDDGVPSPPSLSYSWTILSGAASLSDVAASAPTLSYGAAGPVALRLVAFDGEIRTFDEVVLDGRFATQVVVGASGQGRVMVPVARPALVTLGIFNFLWMWNELLFSLLILQHTASQTLVVKVAGLQGEYTTNVPYLSAGLLLAALPVLIVFLIFQSQLTKGMTLGAVK